MIKGPSNQKTYAEYYSGDPAFRQLVENANAAETKQYVADIERARDTGDWSHLLIEGQIPTTFHVRPMPGEAWRELVSRIEARETAVKLSALAFRACIQKIDNGGMDGPIKPELHPQLGQIATVAITNQLDAIDPGIVSEIGLLMITRGTQGLPPKS